jgi:hypothetical protein
MKESFKDKSPSKVDKKCCIQISMSMVKAFQNQTRLPKFIRLTIERTIILHRLKGSLEYLAQ